MKIGFDIDGVLANFDASWRQLVVRVTGKDLFPPDPPGSEMGPATWNWDLDSGYTPGEVTKCWEEARALPRFWELFRPLSGAETLAMCIVELEQDHEVYFVTNRMGTAAKTQTERWLTRYIGLECPTVLLCGDKGAACRALKLDAYIDDNLDNVKACVREVQAEYAMATIEGRTPKFGTRIYLLDKHYNRQEGTFNPSYTRVRSVGQFLDYELTGLAREVISA